VQKFAPEVGKKRVHPITEETDGPVSTDGGLYSMEAEVICKMYLSLGTAMLPKIRGDYSLVIYDDETRRVLAARSASGKEPLRTGRLEDGTILVSSCLQFSGRDLEEIPPAHFIYGRNPSARPFARSEEEVKAKGAIAASAALKALRGAKAVVHRSAVPRPARSSNSSSCEPSDLSASAPMFVPSRRLGMNSLDEQRGRGMSSLDEQRASPASSYGSGHGNTLGSSSSSSQRRGKSGRSFGGLSYEAAHGQSAPGRAAAATSWRRSPVSKEFDDSKLRLHESDSAAKPAAISIVAAAAEEDHGRQAADAGARARAAVKKPVSSLTQSLSSQDLQATLASVLEAEGQQQPVRISRLATGLAC